MRIIIILAGVTVLAGCDRSISETGANASADSQQLGAIKAQEHNREAVIAPGGPQTASPAAVIAVTPSLTVQH